MLCNRYNCFHPYHYYLLGAKIAVQSVGVHTNHARYMMIRYRSDERKATYIMEISSVTEGRFGSLIRPSLAWKNWQTFVRFLLGLLDTVVMLLLECHLS